MSPIVAPSILASDFAFLAEEIEKVNESEADWVHCDVMDGRFVPNISFGLPIIEAVKKHSRKPLDVHLMIVEPEKYIQAFKDAGADHLTLHVEATHHLDRSVYAIREAGMKAGVAINPATSLERLEYVLPEVFQVCMMTVNPGFGGQSFIPYSYRKLEKLRAMIDKAGTNTLIEIDGGVNEDTAAELIRRGADVLVAGSYVFRSDKPQEKIAYLKSLN